MNVSARGNTLSCAVTPWRWEVRIGEYFVVAAVVYTISEQLTALPYAIHMATNVVLFLTAICYAVWREKIDIRALVASVLGKFLGKQR